MCCAVLQAGVSPTGTFSAESQFWVNEVRTHAVVGNGGSSGSDVDTAVLANLRLARVGYLFESILFIFRACQPKKKRLNGAEASGIFSGIFEVLVPQKKKLCCRSSDLFSNLVPLLNVSRHKS